MAIARVASDKKTEDVGGGSSITLSYNVAAGSNRLLVGGVGAQVTNPVIASFTFNGDAGTVDKSEVDSIGGDRVTVCSLVAPDVATGNVVATKTGASNQMDLAVANYTGAKQTSQPNGTGSAATTSGAGLSYTVTTTEDDCWIMTMVNHTDAGAITGTSNFTNVQTLRAGVEFADSNGSVGAAGSKTVSFTGASARWWSASAAYAPTTNVDTVLNLSENLSNAIIERLSRIWNAPRSQSEVILLQSEGVTRAWALSRGLPTDFLTITESVNGLKSRIIEIMETLGIVERFSRSVQYVRVLSEAPMTIIEAVIRAFIRTVSLLESVIITEYIAISKILSVIITNFVSIIEHVRFPLNWLKRTKPTTTWTPRTKP